MQLRRGQTPDSRSPLLHYCIFKPLSPCGNSQFDDADLQCWQANLTISMSKGKTKRDAVCDARKSPALYANMHFARKSLKDKTACGWVLKASVPAEIKNFQT